MSAATRKNLVVAATDGDEEFVDPFTSYPNEWFEAEAFTPSDSAPKPDRPKAERFLTLLDPGATFFTFQTFDDDKERKDPKLARVMHGTLDALWAGSCASKSEARASSSW